jgi:predicted small secreted protein
MLNSRSGALPVPAAWLLCLVMVGLLTLSTTACNTAEGFGEDVEAAGDAISDTASDVKDEMN